MKKIVILLIILVLSSSLCNADDIFNIQKENWSLKLNSAVGKGIISLVFAFIVFVLGLKLISIERIETINKYKYISRFSPIELLNRRYAQGEITQEEFEKIKQEIKGISSDIDKYKIVTLHKTNILALPEKTHK